MLGIKIFLDSQISKERRLLLNLVGLNFETMILPRFSIYFQMSNAKLKYPVDSLIHEYRKSVNCFKFHSNFH